MGLYYGNKGRAKCLYSPAIIELYQQLLSGPVQSNILPVWCGGEQQDPLQNQEAFQLCTPNFLPPQPDSAAFFNLHDINITKLLSSLQTNSVWKEMAVVLQCCLSDKGTIFEETSHEFLVNVLIQKDLTQQESEKEIQLGMLR